MGLAALLLAALGATAPETSTRAPTDANAPVDATPPATPDASATEANARPTGSGAPPVDALIDPFSSETTPGSTEHAETRPPAPPSHVRHAGHAKATAPLRDPFVGPPVTTRRVSSDLKDPFVDGNGALGRPVRPIRDLVDPFEPRDGGRPPGACTTTRGVPVQRPKSMRAAPPQCPTHHPPLLDPFATA